MKEKIIHESFDHNTGATTVTIRTKYGDFTGKSTLHPDDERRAYTGTKNAIFKARMKAAKKRLSQMKNERNTLVQFYDILAGMRNVNLNSAEMKRFRKEIFDRANKIEKCSTNIETMERAFVEHCYSSPESFADKIARVKERNERRLKMLQELSETAKGN